MVQRYRKNNMASEQPVKKKLRITIEESNETTDETDFVQTVNDNAMHTDLSGLHLSLPLTSTVVEEDTEMLLNNRVNSQLNDFIFNECGEVVKNGEENYDGSYKSNATSFVCSLSNIADITKQPAPDIIQKYQTHNIYENINNVIEGNFNEVLIKDEEMFFHSYLIEKCLCNISDEMLQKSFNTTDNSSSITLLEWPTTKILQFLSNLHLLFDVYLKQNNNGRICSKIVYLCNIVINNEYNLIDQLINLNESRNKYINYMVTKVLSSFLIVAKTSINNEWLESIINFLTVENFDYMKMNFSLEIIKRVVEWKDVEMHILEDPANTTIQQNIVSNVVAGTSNDSNRNGRTTPTSDKNCSFIIFNDVDRFDTTAIKGLIIKSLEQKWPELINKVQLLILNNNTVESKICIITFLKLWESIISVKANLSIIDIKPFYAHLERFVSILSNNLSALIWKQLLSLFNEVLCYGSTLALQDILPEDTCQLAHLIVRYVKDYRFLDCLPVNCNNSLIRNNFIGTIDTSRLLIQNQEELTRNNIDKILIQKMTLLVLKSVAITIKETRSDSSDSSIGSDDLDFYQDMQVITRSIRDVIKKLDLFIKTSLDYHPEQTFSKILINLFNDQDDYMIESMVCTLDITTGICYANVVPPDFIAILNPIHSFIEFLKIVSHDSGVLLDYLVSNETCFLLYLLRLLKYIKRNWNKFIDGCCDNGNLTRNNQLDNTMTVLIRLKIQINQLVSKKLFPYNIYPVLKHLNSCENLYEGNGNS